MKAILGLVNGLETTRNTRGDKSPAEMGRAKRGGLRWVRRVLTGSKGRWLMVATLFGVLSCLLMDAHGQVVVSDPKGRALEMVRNSLSAEFEKVVVLKPKEVLVMRPLGDYASHRGIPESTRCVYVIEYRPTWVCDAVASGIIRLDPCGGRPIPDYNCTYWGDCKCPDTVITGCP
jgi:hypothetical protein